MTERDRSEVPRAIGTDGSGGGERWPYTKILVSTELFFARAFVTVALPVVLGRWHLTFGIIAAVPCAAYFCWQVAQGWRQFVRGGH